MQNALVVWLVCGGIKVINMVVVDGGNDFLVIEEVHMRVGG